MTQLSIRITGDLCEQAKEFAKQQELSLNKFCATAIARAVGEAQARRFFAQRARGLSAEKGRKRFSAVLEKVEE